MGIWVVVAILSVAWITLLLWPEPEEERLFKKSDFDNAIFPGVSWLQANNDRLKVENEHLRRENFELASALRRERLESRYPIHFGVDLGGDVPDYTVYYRTFPVWSPDMTHIVYWKPQFIHPIEKQIKVLEARVSELEVNEKLTKLMKILNENETKK